MAVDFALALYNWRMEHKYTQAQAATILGVYPTNISDYERRRISPSKRTLERIGPIINFPPKEEPKETEELECLMVHVPAPQTRPSTFTERMAARDRERLSDNYMERTRQMVAQRENGSNNREQLIRIAGFLEGMQAALQCDLSKQINILNSMIEE